MKKKRLYTVGYEGVELTDFLATLVKNKIKQIIDVRDLPLSRKRGFSKNALAAALAELDISYLHLKSLGDPKPGREAARSGDLSTFRRIYGRHLAGPDGQAGLVTAAAAARKITSSLLCYESSYIDCHRAIIADRLSNRFTIQHLAVISTVTKRRKIADGHVSGIVAFG